MPQLSGVHALDPLPCVRLQTLGLLIWGGHTASADRQSSCCRCGCCGWCRCLSLLRLLLLISGRLQEADRLKKRLYFYCGPHAHHKANSAVLVGPVLEGVAGPVLQGPSACVLPCCECRRRKLRCVCMYACLLGWPQVGIYQVLYLNRTAEEAYKPLLAFKPYAPFRDASCGVSTFHLTVFDVIKVGGAGAASAFACKNCLPHQVPRPPHTGHPKGEGCWLY